MGQGGYLVLVNATDSDWELSHYHYYQMNEWSFPAEIPAGDFAQIYIEWDEGLFRFVKDDAAEARYELKGTGGKEFEVQARAEPFRIQVSYMNMEPEGKERGGVDCLGWVRDGEITFVLSQCNKGKYFIEYY
nr:uncharacterized protein LOC106692597 [Halyomorpha halys]